MKMPAFVQQIDTKLVPVFAGLPHIPASVRNFLVSIAPWVSVISGALGVLGIAAALNVGLFTNMMFGGFVMMHGFAVLGPLMILSLIANGIGAVLELLAFTPLSRQHKSGWDLVFASSLLSVLSLVFVLLMSSASLVGGLIGLFIRFWLLYEVRSSYRV